MDSLNASHLCDEAAHEDPRDVDESSAGPEQQAPSSPDARVASDLPEAPADRSDSDVRRAVRATLEDINKDCPWVHVPPTFIRQVLLRLHWQDVRVVRMVCRAWRRAHGTCVAALTPTLLTAETITELFPSLVSLDLSRVTEQSETELKQQLVELSVGSTGKLHILKMPDGIQLDDLMLAVIASFGSLNYLNLEGTNSVTDCGSFSALSPLQSLQSLDLTGATGLSDLGIGSLSTLPSLTQVNLKGCYEVTNRGLASLCGITRLTDLNLEGCGNMDDEALAQLTALTNLHVLNLSYCGQVTDRGIAAIAGPPTASSLIASGDALGGISLALGGLMSVGGASGAEASAGTPALVSLTSLSVSGCPDITDASLGAIMHLTQLRMLELIGCWMVTGAGLASLTTLRDLRSLSIEVKEGLDDTSLAAMACLPMLSNLRMERCNFCVSYRGIERMEQMHSLEQVEIVYCSGVSDVFVATLGHLSSLERVSLLKSEVVSQAGLAALSGLTNLEHLDLTGCTDVSDVVFLCLARLQLRSLVLEYCGSWTLSGMEALATISTLTRLELGYTQTHITDDCITAICSGLTRLRQLDLSGASLVTDGGYAQLSKCQQLETLDLEGCVGMASNGMKAISGLQSLTSLSLQECPGVGAEEAKLLTALSALRVLRIIDCPAGMSVETVDLLAQLPFIASLTAGL